MQKLVYLSNSRDYSEQGDINENKYFKNVNNLLGEGWTVSNISHSIVEVSENNSFQKETFLAFVLLEKSGEEK